MLVVLDLLDSSVVFDQIHLAVVSSYVCVASFKVPMLQCGEKKNRIQTEALAEYSGF